MASPVSTRPLSSLNSVRWVAICKTHFLAISKSRREVECLASSYLRRREGLRNCLLGRPGAAQFVSSAETTQPARLAAVRVSGQTHLDAAVAAADAGLSAASFPAAAPGWRAVAVEPGTAPVEVQGVPKRSRRQDHRVLPR